MSLRLNHAGTGDEKKTARANMHGPDFKGVAHEADFILPDTDATASGLVNAILLILRGSATIARTPAPGHEAP